MDIGGSCTWDADDPQTFFWQAGPGAGPEAGSNLTTFDTSRLTLPPYAGRGCFVYTASIPAGGTAADQRLIIDDCAYDKLLELENELLGGGTVVPGVGGVSWLQGRLLAPKANTRKTTCFAVKWNNTGSPDGLKILVAVSGSYLAANVADAAAQEATWVAVSALIGCITMPS